MEGVNPREGYLNTPTITRSGVFYSGEDGLSSDLDEGSFQQSFLVSHKVGFDVSAESFPFWIITRSFL